MLSKVKATCWKAHELKRKTTPQFTWTSAVYCEQFDMLVCQTVKCIKSLRNGLASRMERIRSQFVVEHIKINKVQRVNALLYVIKESEQMHCNACAKTANLHIFKVVRLLLLDGLKKMLVFDFSRNMISMRLNAYGTRFWGDADISEPCDSSHRLCERKTLGIPWIRVQKMRKSTTTFP